MLRLCLALMLGSGIVFPAPDDSIDLHVPPDIGPTDMVCPTHGHVKTYSEAWCQKRV